MEILVSVKPRISEVPGLGIPVELDVRGLPNLDEFCHYSPLSLKTWASRLSRLGLVTLGVG